LLFGVLESARKGKKSFSPPAVRRESINSLKLIDNRVFIKEEAKQVRVKNKSRKTISGK